MRKEIQEYLDADLITRDGNDWSLTPKALEITTFTLHLLTTIYQSVEHDSGVDAGKEITILLQAMDVIADYYEAKVNG